MQAGAVLLDAPRHLLHDLLRRHLDAHQGLTLLLLRHDGGTWGRPEERDPDPGEGGEGGEGSEPTLRTSLALKYWVRLWTEPFTMSYVCPKLPSTGILSQHQLRITEGMEGTGLEVGGV